MLAAVILGVVPTDQAFSGFGHPATVVIAMVLIVSRGLSNSGAVDLLARAVAGAAKALTGHILVMSGLGAALSALMNNVGALALLMPVDIQAAKKAKRAVGLTLMPLSFASILGGLVTLIGTPPNIIIAAYRERRALGEPYSMFDFTPVGGACARGRDPLRRPDRLAPDPEAAARPPTERRQGFRPGRLHRRGPPSPKDAKIIGQEAA